MYTNYGRTRIGEGGIHWMAWLGLQTLNWDEGQLELDLLWEGRVRDTLTQYIIIQCYESRTKNEFNKSRRSQWLPVTRSAPSLDHRHHHGDWPLAVSDLDS